MSFTSVEQTLAQRQNVHGDFGDNSQVTHDLMMVICSTKNWKSLTPVQMAALYMIQHKISRILSGDPNFADHWHDIGGYAKCAEERLIAPHFCARCLKDYTPPLCPTCPKD